MIEQLSFFDVLELDAPVDTGQQFIPDLEIYDTIIVYMSAGKDSTAALLFLLENGVDPKRIEIWHHDIDSRESTVSFMDWPITPAYCRTLAEAFDIPIYFSWKTGGFKQEMLRTNAPTASIKFETPDGEVVEVGGKSNKLGTRRKFPQVSGDLRVRWCSAYLKVDPSAAAIRNQPRFLNKKVLTVSGERADESPQRSRYPVFDKDRSDNRGGKHVDRHVDRWRPVHQWTEKQVWAIIEKYGVNPHPAYKISPAFGRTSCALCIFSSSKQLADLNQIAPEMVRVIEEYETEFGVTIHRTKSIAERIAEANGGTGEIDWDAARLAMSKEYTDSIIVSGKWILPPGAFGDSSGPT